MDVLHVHLGKGALPGEVSLSQDLFGALPLYTACPLLCFSEVLISFHFVLFCFVCFNFPTATRTLIGTLCLRKDSGICFLPASMTSAVILGLGCVTLLCLAGVRAALGPLLWPLQQDPLDDGSSHTYSSFVRLLADLLEQSLCFIRLHMVRPSRENPESIYTIASGTSESDGCSLHLDHLFVAVFQEKGHDL